MISARPMKFCKAREERRPPHACLVRAHVAAQSAMHPSAKLMAFQDDVYVVRSPPQVAACYTHLERELWAHAGIRINLGKTQIFNRAGVLPPDCQHIIRAGRQLNPPVVVWRGDSALPPDQRGVTILGRHQD